MEYKGKVGGTGDKKTRENEITSDDIAVLRNYIYGWNYGVVNEKNWIFNIEEQNDNVTVTINKGIMFAYGYFGVLSQPTSLTFIKTSVTQYRFIYAEIDKSVVPNTFSIKIKNNQGSNKINPNTFRQDYLSAVKTGVFQLPLWQITLGEMGIEEIKDIRPLRNYIMQTSFAEYATEKVIGKISETATGTTQDKSDISKKLATTQFVKTLTRNYIDNEQDYTLITFNIMAVEYKAKYWHTWGDWIKSSYNNGEYVENVDGSISPLTNLSTYVYSYPSKQKVLSSDLIIKNADYVVAKYEENGSDSSELQGTWVWNERITLDFGGYYESENIQFISNSNSYIGIRAGGAEIIYGDTRVCYGAWGEWLDGGVSSPYRAITFESTQTVSQEFYNWFTANAVKQETTYTIPVGTYVFNEELDFTNISADINESFTFTPIDGYKSNLIGITVNPVPIITYYKGVSDGYNVYNTGWLDEDYRTITLETDQTVSQEFYEWFMTNGIIYTKHN